MAAYISAIVACQGGGLIVSRTDMPQNELKIPPRGVCNATVMRMASRRMSHLYDTALSPIGLRSTQFSLLAELGRRQGDPPTMMELAQTMAMERSTLGQNMLPLERDGFVVQRRDIEDGRRRRLHLTPEGREKLVAGLPLWEKAQRRFEEAVGSMSTEELRKILLAIISSHRLGTADQD